MTKVLTYIEIDVDFCALTYHTAPCTAALGITGSTKCFNSIKTCQDRVHFSNSPATLRFGLDNGILPDSIECIPSITGVQFTPATISLGKDLGTRASLSVSFKDHPHSDTGTGFDKYRLERGYDPFKRGSFWGKFRARQPFLRGRPIRLIRGVLGQTITQMTTRHFLIEDFDGPNAQGQYSITAKDILKLADGDRAQAPILSNGYLSASLTSVNASFTASPTGIGNAEYPASGYIAIGGEEVCSFTRAGDIFTITRAQKGTVAAAHDASDRVQLCLDYVAETPADIIYDLLVNYAGVPFGYVDLFNWQTEVGQYLQRLYSATIADPVDVKTLVSELIEQAGLALWWSDTEQLIKLQVLRKIVTLDTFSADNVIENTLDVKEQPDKRITEVWTYYGQRNPLLKIDEVRNWRSTLATVDLQTESDYGAVAIQKIFARWIPAFGLQIAERLNDIQLARYVNPPRAVSFMSHRFGDITPALGGGYNLDAWTLQDETGQAVSVPIQITRLNPDESAYIIEAEELTIVSSNLDDLFHRIITIDTDVNDFNLRTIHDSLYPTIVAGESPSVDITCVINSGVIVGSSSSLTFAFDVGSWPAGVPIRLIINGRIQGAGGNGGPGKLGLNGGNHQGDGHAGGTAFYTRYPITIDIQSGGQVWGGGGGGGGGYVEYPTAYPYYTTSASGGGGGQGRDGGLGGLHYSGYYDSASDGAAGSSETPGSYGTVTGSAVRGGTGGEEGQPGSPGQTNNSPYTWVGGAAGVAIDGRSYVLLDGGSPGIEILGGGIN